MIKVSSKVTQFSVNNVVIDPDDLPSAGAVCPVKVGKQTQYKACTMYGYYAKGNIDEGEFFISSNQFWLNENYGDNTIKAFRSTFVIDATLSEDAASRITMSFEEKATDINDINVADDSADEYYNLQGQRVDTPAKGVFIKGGKKILVK